MASKFEVFEDRAGEFRFRLKAANGETILTSEGYTAKTAAVKGIESVRVNAADECRFEAISEKRGAHRFNLKAGNHQIVGTSELYTSKLGRDKGMKAVSTAAREARVVDLTR